MRRCNKCRQIKPLDEYHKRVDGKDGRRAVCKQCVAVCGAKVAAREDFKERRRKYAKRRRKDPSKRPNMIFKDSRKSDKKRGFANDLTLDFIKSVIANGCDYCGESGLQMTLDRIDHACGHTKDNVIPACIRCNFIRRDMPYVAWKKLIPKLKEIVELGLFEEWTGSIH